MLKSYDADSNSVGNGGVFFLEDFLKSFICTFFFNYI